MGYSQGSLISCIYDLALRHSTWDNILDILSATFPGAVILVSGDDASRRSNVVFAQRGLPSSAIGPYITAFAGQNPWLSATAELPPFQVFQDDQLVPRAESRASDYYRKWLEPHGDFSAATGMVLMREGARQLTLEIRYPANDAERREQVTGVLSEAAHHFRRAFEILGRSRFSGGSGYLEGIVEDLPFTVFFVNEDMRIRYGNFHAESMRRQGDGPFATADGVLRATDPVTDEALRALIRKTIGTRRAPTSVLQINRPGSEERFFAMARLALRTGTPYQLHDAILDPGPLVMLIVHGSLEVATLPTDLLWRAFSLTDSEASLAEALLNGETLADFAREREVSKQTLRNQLVGVMRKTGTRRQAELVALLTRLALTCF